MTTLILSSVNIVYMQIVKQMTVFWSQNGVETWCVDGKQIDFFLHIIKIQKYHYHIDGIWIQNYFFIANTCEMVFMFKHIQK